MSVTLPGGIPATEFISAKDPVSPQIEFRKPEGFVATRIYDIDWAYLDDACKNILGYSELDVSNHIHRVLPMRDPHFDTLVAMSIPKIELIGSGRTLSIPDYEDKPRTFPELPDVERGRPDGTTSVIRGNRAPRARLTVTFARPNYRIYTDSAIYTPDLISGIGVEFQRFVEVSSTLENGYASVASLQNKLKFVGSNSGIDGGDLGDQLGIELKEAPPRIFGEATITIKWHEVPYNGLPMRNILQGIGKINDVNFGLVNDPTRYWLARRLLFIGAQWEPIFMPNQYWGWELTYYFKYRQVPWTHYLNTYGTADIDWYPANISGTYTGNYPLSTVELPATNDVAGTPIAGYVAPSANDFTYNPYDFRLLFTPFYVAQLQG